MRYGYYGKFHLATLKQRAFMERMIQRGPWSGHFAGVLAKLELI